MWCDQIKICDVKFEEARLWLYRRRCLQRSNKMKRKCLVKITISVITCRGGEGAQRVKFSKTQPESTRGYVLYPWENVHITHHSRELRIRARTKKRKKRRNEKPGGVPTHSRRSFPFQGTLGPQANCRSGPKRSRAITRWTYRPALSSSPEARGRKGLKSGISGTSPLTSAPSMVMTKTPTAT